MSSFADPIVDGARRARPVRPRRAPVSRLGLILMAPALLLLTLFFFLPVALTGVFAFTDLSTSTGIGRGDYVVTPTLLRQLGDKGLSDTDAEAVARSSVTVDAAGLARARAAGVDDRFLDEIERRFMGRDYEAPAGFVRDLRGLRTAPRRPRDLKSAAALFETSVLNQRFATSQALAAQLEAMAPEIAPAVRARIVEASFTGARFTTENFRTLATQKETARLVGNTFLYVGATLSLFNVGLGLFLAVVLFYMPKGASSLFSTLWLLPRITPVVLYAVMWKWFTWEGGFLPILADQVGLPSFNYMKGSVVTAWATMITLNGFIGASFGLILFSGALRAIPLQQLWASEVDGASRWQQVRRIILPQMRWPILFVTAYQTLSLLSSYEQIWLTTNGGPGRTTSVWALEAFKTALSNYTGNLEYGMGAAMALVLVVVGLALSLIYLRLFKFSELVGRPKIEI
ncbi:sugar ABC transporter permease [Mesobaculum littorinae]|uniref:Sugar ABC transporter permease n=1 Tax=Mesobaculum littorinae TaxID=2486419 RepID=A0A438AKH9_9RHOB|nr:sugar ABC transporter permease [Mesobaculum littorinae]RVV99192.1 sugar ABC transporter permease [Mesobaculum littorinae]